MFTDFPRRVHLIEFHEQKWFPELLRNFITDVLTTMWAFSIPFIAPLCPMEAISPVLTRVIYDSHATSILGLCSGAGGPETHLARLLYSQRPCPVDFVYLTDLYPNVPAFVRAQRKCERLIRYVHTPVDATSESSSSTVMRISPPPRVLRALFASFHHMSPPSAQRIISAAVLADDAIAICEFTARTPMAVLFVACVVFPFSILASLYLLLQHPNDRLLRLLFCILLPIVPLVLLVDGLVSCLRTYSEDEMYAMAARADPQQNYIWRFERVPVACFGIFDVCVFSGVPKLPRS